jgi:hypothetical protein
MIQTAGAGVRLLILTIIASILGVSSAFSKTVVISDIDDTLKVVNVASPLDSVISALDDDKYFVGMPTLFRGIKNKDKTTEFHYVSLAPKLLMFKRHEDFIKRNRFPLTQLHLNPSTKQNPQVKIEIIKKIINDTQPSSVLMFGDNGQMDSAIYAEIQSQYPTIPFLIYIHEVQSKINKAKYPTLANQVGYATALELGKNLILNDLIAADLYEDLEQVIYSRIKYSKVYRWQGEYVIPDWMDCRDFHWPENFVVSTEKAIYIKKYVQARCQSEPMNDSL